MGPDWLAFPEIAEINRATGRDLTPQTSAVLVCLGLNIPVCRENTRVDLARLGWLGVVLVCLIAVLILVLEGYFGYAGVTFAVAVSAGINLT
jgi:hypothetical protein